MSNTINSRYYELAMQKNQDDAEQIATKFDGKFNQENLCCKIKKTSNTSF